MDIVHEIRRLKRQKRAVILAHNYQRPEVQDVADFVGDSLGLSIQAAGTDADVIVFCGVHFMAETAKILSPGKTVLLPDPHASCPMADMITASDVMELRSAHQGAKVLCYVNTSASVKAACDACCTSANASSVARALMKGGSKVVFVPDMHLGSFVKDACGGDLILWRGFCPTHARITESDIETARRLHPGALVLAHPECTPEVRLCSDSVLSTEGMCWFAAESHASEFIVATETGILHRLTKENPSKRFYPATIDAVCPNMKRITLEKVLLALETMEHEIVLDRDTLYRARQCVRTMMAFRS